MRNPLFKAALLLPLLILTPGPAPAAEVDSSFLQASVALDRALIPALGIAGGEAEGDVESAVARLADAWQAYSTSQEEVLKKAAGWSLVQRGISRRIEMAGRFIRNDDAHMAHILLSQVREDLVRIRVVLEAGYFVDRLVRFEAAMESVLGDGGRGLADRDRDALVKGIADLRDRWREIAEVEIDPDVYGFLWKDLSALGDLLKSEGNAIRDLYRAAAGGRTDQLDQLADPVRSGFTEVYLVFGASE